MENNENRQNEELQFSNQDHTLDSDNTTVRKTRIKHKRGPRKKKEKKTMSKNTKKRIFITLGSVVGVVAAVYLGGAFYFHSHFYPHTTINGSDFSWKSVASAEEHMKNQVESYTLTLKEKNGQTEEISGQDIDVIYKKNHALEKV